MGTRSTTKVYAHGEPVVNMYGQYDGYPMGVGQQIKDFVSGKRVVNGYTAGDTIHNAFNGASCMAAALVSYFKTKIGGHYLYPMDAGREEWNYELWIGDGVVHIEVLHGDDSVFCGPISSFDPKAVEDEVYGE